MSKGRPGQVQQVLAYVVDVVAKWSEENKVPARLEDDLLARLIQVGDLHASDPSEFRRRVFEGLRRPTRFAAKARVLFGPPRELGEVSVDRG
jgi:hypothetical protein